MKKRERIPPNPKSQLIFGLVLLALSIGLIIYQLGWIRSVIAGPTPFAAEDLAEISSPDELDNPWLELEIPGYKESGLTMEKGPNDSSKYLFVPVLDRWLIADVTRDFNADKAVGFIDVWSTPLKKDAISALEERFPDKKLLPFQFDAHFSYKGEFWSFIATVAAFVVGGIYMTVIGLRAIKPPEPDTFRRE